MSYVFKVGDTGETVGGYNYTVISNDNSKYWPFLVTVASESGRGANLWYNTDGVCAGEGEGADFTLLPPSVKSVDPCYGFDDDCQCGDEEYVTPSYETLADELADSFARLHDAMAELENAENAWASAQEAFAEFLSGERA